MRSIVLTVLLLAGCAQAPPLVGPDLALPASNQGQESTQATASVTEGACTVTLEHIPAPPVSGMSGVKRWFRVTYHGRGCYENKQKPGANPYYPAPIYAAWPNGPGIQMWGGDHFMAYLWPNVTCCMVVNIRATAPNGSYAQLAYRIDEDDF